MFSRSTKFVLFILGTIGTFLLPLASTTASTIFLEPIVTDSNPNFPDGVILQTDFLPNTPLAWLVPDTTGNQNFLNNTGLDITSFKLILGTEQYNGNNVVWGDANGDGKIGQSNIFSSFQINPNNSRPQLDITKGLIPNGNRFVFKFISSPDLTPDEPGDNGPLTVAGIYDGVVPTLVFEPTPTLGLLLILGYMSKKFLNKLNHTTRA
jgi:hypothetical protein